MSDWYDTHVGLSFSGHAFYFVGLTCAYTDSIVLYEPAHESVYSVYIFMAFSNNECPGKPVPLCRLARTLAAHIHEASL